MDVNLDNGFSAESFKLLELLGSGGFAHTYKAKVLDEDLIEDYGTDTVALKIPLNKEKERILRREIEKNILLHIRLKEVKSQNIVRYLGFDVFRGQTIMVMEYAPGSLRDVVGKVSRQKPMDINQAVSIAKGVLNGLIAIHKEGIFHRDIKPENLLGMKSGAPKIADLGIARMLESNQLASTTTGTIFYMSPEILGNEGASFKSDIWSLGVTLYEMLTGRLPFGEAGMPLGTIADLIRTSEPMSACAVRPEIPKLLSDVIAKSLTKNSSERYDTNQMLEALTNYEQGNADNFEQEVARIHELEDSERLDSIKKMYESLVKKFPDRAQAYLQLGAFHNKYQNHKKAEEVLKKGLALEPDNELLNFTLGTMYFTKGEKQKTIDCFKKVMLYGKDISLKRKAKTLLKRLGFLSEI